MRLSLTKFFIAACFSMMTVPAFAADCVMPNPPSVPDGATASEAVMSAAVADIKGYMADNQDYRRCIENKETNLGDTATPDQKALLTAAYNQSVEKEQQTAELFNEQLRIMKAADTEAAE